MPETKNQRVHLRVAASDDELFRSAAAAANESLSEWLLRDAMLPTLAASETIGVRALLVHTIDDPRAFYRRHGLRPSPTDPLHLMILIKDIATVVGAARKDR